MAATNSPLSPLAGGHYWLYGKHAVLAALANTTRVQRRLLMTPKAHQALDGALKIKPQLVEMKAMNALLPEGAVHQGIALEVQPLPQPQLEDVASQNKPLLMLDQVSDPHNIGAILRSAAAFGVGGMIVQDRHAPKESAIIAKTAAGALELVPMVSVTNLSRAIEQLQRDHGYFAIGMAGNAKLNLSQLTLEAGKAVLVMGAEGRGLRPLIEKHCDELVKLPMNPQMESLNVSVAAGIGLYELMRGAV